MSKKVSNFNGKKIEDFKKVLSFNVKGKEVFIDINRNNQVHEVHPRWITVFEVEVPLYDFLHGRTAKSALEFLINLEKL